MRIDDDQRRHLDSRRANAFARASSSAPASTRTTPRTQPRSKPRGAEIVTVALRRVNVADPGSRSSIDHIDPKKYVYLPNTAGCYTADEAVRTLRLAREAGGWTLVKLEVLGDRKTLYPDMIETLRAAEVLVNDGFDVMVYCSDDPLMCKRLEDAGCAAIMPLAAAHRLRPRHPEPGQHPPDRRASPRARHRRRRRRHGVATPRSRWNWAATASS